MPFYKRGFLYLARKRAKSILLLLIFLFVNSMILSTNMILHATERTEAAMQEKVGAKVVCEVMNTAHLITDTEAEKLRSCHFNQSNGAASRIFNRSCTS